MLAYRITKNKYASDTTGEGARLYGGRWNSIGTPMLYLSESRSLAAIEFLVHVPVGILPKNLKIIEFELPEIKMKTLSLKQLPTDWDSYPAPDSLAEIGSNWIQSKKGLILKVPSVVSKGDFNLLCNPLHEKFKNINITNIFDYNFDKRFFRENIKE